MHFQSHYRGIDSRTAVTFDTLRGGSAVIVVVSHAVFYLQDQSATLVRMLLNAGQLAVITFFVISGFMICSSILRRVDAGSPNRFDSKSFARDRLHRLVPPLLFATVLMAICYLFLLSRNSAGYGEYWSFAQALAGLLFLLDMGIGVSSPYLNGPLWSLSHELWFYVAGAFVTLQLLHARRRFRLLAYTLPMLILASFVNARWCAGFVIWMLGALLALVYHQPLEAGRTYQSRTIESFLCAKTGGNATRFIAIATLLVITLLGISGNAIGYGKYCFGAMLVVTLYVCTILPARTTSIAAREGVNKAVPGNLFSGVAPYSYTLYIIHFPLLLVWFELFRSATNTVFTSALSFIFYLVVIFLLSRKVAEVIEKKSRSQ